MKPPTSCWGKRRRTKGSNPQIKNQRTKRRKKKEGQSNNPPPKKKKRNHGKPNPTKKCPQQLPFVHWGCGHADQRGNLRDHQRATNSTKSCELLILDGHVPSAVELAEHTSMPGAGQPKRADVAQHAPMICRVQLRPCPGKKISFSPSSTQSAPLAAMERSRLTFK